jgi:hypothetical protein
MPVLYQPWPLDSGDERRRAETATLSSNASRPSPRHALHSTEKKPWAAPTSRARWRHAADSCRLPAMRRYPVASKLLQRSLGECSDAASAQTLTPCERRGHRTPSSTSGRLHAPPSPATTACAWSALSLALSLASFPSLSPFTHKADYTMLLMVDRAHSDSDEAIKFHLGVSRHARSTPGV